MSLFHLFSKPKVERAHGYGENGTDSLPARTGASTTKADTDAPGRVTDTASIRAHSIFSFRNSRKDSATSRPYAPEFKQPPRERKIPHFDPPPLFQAFPQSVKDGVLEISSASDSSARSKARKQSAPRLQLPNGTVLENVEENVNPDGRLSLNAGTKNTLSGTTGLLSKKMFVLVTSGYLLQYSNSGPSDRLPEKMMPLGKDSAAFASDLVPGKPYTLQVAEAIDQNGNPVLYSSSLFSKLAIRSLAAKRITSNFVLVMQDGKDMESWMTALRKQIELAGGRKSVADTSIRPQTNHDVENTPELRKTPSHRYLVKRDPTKVSNVSSPATTPASEPPAFNLPVPATEDGKSESSRPQSSASEPATIDGIELEASRLADGRLNSPALPQMPPDVYLSNTSALKKAASTGGLRVNTTTAKPVKRASQFSTVDTAVVVTSPLSPETFLESPTSDDEPNSSAFDRGQRHSLRDGVSTFTTTVEKPAFTRKHSLPNVRSALPTTIEVPELPRRTSLQQLSRMPKPTEIILPPRPPALSNKIMFDSGLESPTVGRHSALPRLATNSLPARRLASPISEPNLPLAVSMSAKEKRDSKMPPPPSLVTPDNARPESFLGDLPPPSTWTSPKPSNRRFSGLQAISPDATSPSSPSALSIANSSSPSLVVPPGILKQASNANQNQQIDSRRLSGGANSRRSSTFNIPLKVNPSAVYNQNAPSLNVRRTSQLSDSDVVSELQQAHTSAPKSEPLAVKRFSLSPTPIPSPVSDRFPTSSNRSSTQLSFYPNQHFSIPNSPSDQSQASPSPTSTATVHTAQVLPLRRPVSLQVRPDYAAFLSNGRNSIVSTTPGSGGAMRPSVITNSASRPPIRGLRASRSASNVPMLASASAASHRHTASPPEAFRGLDFGTTEMPLSEEAYEIGTIEQTFSEQPAPSSVRPHSPPASRSTSRQSTNRRTSGPKAAKPRSSLAELDMGILSLGPPAPPPSAPLPATPPSAPPPSTPLPAPPAAAAVNGVETRTAVNRSSRGSRKGSRSGIPSVRDSAAKSPVGMGLELDSAAAVSPSSERVSPVRGLGIQVT